MSQNERIQLDDISTETLIKLLTVLANRQVEIIIGNEKTELPDSVIIILQQILRNKLADADTLLITEDLTPEDAATVLQVSKSSLINLLDRGEIPYYMVGNNRGVKLEEILKYQKDKK